MAGSIPAGFGMGAAKYGAPTQGPSINTDSTQLSTVATASAGDPGANPLHPSNPLVAFGVIAAFAFGLMAVSTSASVRVGRAKAGAGVHIGE